MEEASRRARLTDFGPQDFVEPLEILTRSYVEEAKLNFVGMMSARTYLLRLLANRLLMERDRRVHPEVAEQEITAPVTILGLPRTGSTLLFELLATDPRLRAPLSWEVMLPSPPPVAGVHDRRIRQAQRLLDWVDRIAPDFKKIHRVGATLPQECIAMCAQAFRSIQFHTTNYVPSYQAWLDTADLEPAYRYHRRMLQQFQARTATGRWLLKAPGHLFGPAALLAIYPDAQIIQTHRDPLKVLGSIASHCASLRQAFSEDIDLEDIGATWSGLWALGLERTLEFRRNNPGCESRFLDVRYADLVANPFAVLEGIYDHLDLSFTAEVRARMQEYLDINRQARFGRHQYRLEDYGLDPEQEWPRFQAYAVGYGVEREATLDSARLQLLNLFNFLGPDRISIMTETLLTFDLGTTRLKVAAFAADGALLAQEAVRHRDHRDERGTYQQPEDWWQDACRLTRALIQSDRVNPEAVLGVSVSGRGGAAVFVDKTGKVVAPSWSDRRHRDQLLALMEWRKGGAFLPNYGAALMAKFQWLREAEPRLARSVAHALYAKDFLLHRLTGEAVTDWTSGPDAPNWDSRALEHTGIDENLLPRAALPWEIGGRVTQEAARELGIRAGVPVAVGAHDGICANIGAGAGVVGAYAITLGTHAVVRAITAEHPEGAYRFYVMPPDRHVIGGNAVMAGRAVDWLLDCFGYPENDRRSIFQQMDARAGKVAVGSEGVRFLPFLAGQVAPEPRPAASAVFAGLRVEHGQAQMYRAVLEGAAFAVRAIFEQVRGWCGGPSVVRLTGSGAESSVWSRILSDAIGCPLEISDVAVEGRGAAMCLAVALGLQPDIDTASNVMAQVRHRVEPGEARGAYDEIYASWRALADATRLLDR